MCRNIKPLFNFEPPATDAEIRDAALQFVRKVSGSTKPSKRNEEAFDQRRRQRSRPQSASCSIRWRRRSPRTARKKPPRRAPG